MKLPPLLLAAATLFWGWQADALLLAAPLAAALEAHRWTALRFAFGPREFSRFASLCTVGFIALVAWLLAASAGAFPRVVLSAFLWLPAVLAPLMLAQLYSVDGRMPLSALFAYLRHMKAKDPTLHDPLVDLAAPYVAICVVAAGAQIAHAADYYIGGVIVAAWALHAVRPRHAPHLAWVAALAIAAAAGFGIHNGLRLAQAALEEWASEWYFVEVGADPYQSTMKLGSVGRLKEIGSIVLRVYAKPSDLDRIHLLHRASFNRLIGDTWAARNAPMEGFEPELDGATWTLAAGTPQWSARFAARLEAGKALLALPAGSLRVTGAAAVEWRRNVLGASRVEFGGDWAQYTVEGGRGIVDYAAPGFLDTTVPARERAEFERLAAELGLAELPPDNALRRVREHFATYSYSTYREAPVPEGSTALGDFLRRSKSGHCEYFAGATTLLLRAAGIPARYATGYAVQEYSGLEDAYVVRARHAHAWTRAWIGGRWIDVDTTPPSWFDEEASRAPFWQAAADVLRWAAFRWSQRGELRLGASGYALIVLLGALLAWRLLRGRRAAKRAHAALDARPVQGSDSEFYAVERALAQKQAPRAPHESLAVWVARAGGSGASQRELAAALELHYRYRFDPEGLSPAERSALRSACLSIMAAWER